MHKSHLYLTLNHICFMLADFHSMMAHAQQRKELFCGRKKTAAVKTAVKRLGNRSNKIKISASRV